MKAIKAESDFFGDALRQKCPKKIELANHHKSMDQTRRQEFEENRSSNALSTGQSSLSVLEQGQSPVDDNVISSTSTICPAPLCRQFWKAGNYEDGLGSKISLQNGKNYLHVHPMFLHSNATSHKWAFGAIAELLDNAVDEIQNGATFVIVDKTSNPRDGSPALLIQDDGGGMDLEAMRRCMSFGFSDKKSKSAIGQYGNGFKTSTMRLGADVIVFSRHLHDRVLTQSIGLLSYTFLTRTGYDRIVVPMVDYEINSSTGSLEISHCCGKANFMSNLSLLLQWSPYSTEAELLKQFDDIGSHGTKVIIYNLWFNDDGVVELDFDTDPQDIRIGGDIKKVDTIPAWRKINEEHIANRLHYSLRVYLSILYLRMPETFRIILRGRVVEHHNLANDLKFQEFILYKPQSGGVVEGQVITTIGFLKEAPHVNVHGFNVYHKNRLILPFWAVVSSFGYNSKGRGVVGILEANFIEPTHDKQDFERTSLFQKLEGRLKEMTFEYWDYHCGLIGYQVIKKPPAQEHKQDSSLGLAHGKTKPVKLSQSSPVGSNVKVSSAAGLHTKRKQHDDLVDLEKVKRQARTGFSATLSGLSLGEQPVDGANLLKYQNQEALNLMQENKKLQAQCLEYEKTEKELDLKVAQLKTEIAEVQCEYDRLMAELTLLDSIKEEKAVNM
ncbi:protein MICRORCHIDIA 6 isoform X1 [Ricinus communis]|uniref:protein MICRORCHIDIA 6 isoform X1 n=1 Tax=Ricinus communis TaxID=3988 RepID=UPI0007721D98|nr:protein MICRORCHIDIA 6 isoform X1 [Ricinus communis]XP_025013966.1 protein MICRORCHIDIA 6 isoform X1 [Ricinus communis]XP_048228612.1 protein MICRORCHIDIA 6 isoform X1 [Ricinus communis]|eukprot:XP_015580189.1 protein MICRORCHIDIA 6 isoform X1 [Ricinus communis]